MTLANLRLIRDIAHHHSISKAARLNDISQSAASQAVQELEREIGVELFDRRTRPLAVTPAGKLYAEYCRDVLRRQGELEGDLRKLRMDLTGKARLASIYSIALSEMAEIEARFATACPGAELEVSYLRPERVWEAVENDDADLGLMSYAESSREVLALPWRDEEMVVAVDPKHKLATQTQVSAESLDGEAFIGFDDDLPIQDQIDRYFRDHKVTVETVLRFDNLEMIKQAVAHGAGISIMPRRTMSRDLQTGRLVALHFDPPELYRPVRIVHRKRKAFNEVTGKLLEVLLEEKARIS